ncbi:D-glycero-alpha-D-manno-heptose-1,7-bisphosphate 7-phosphatase [Rhizobium sp. PL01]|uniref:D-glycero-alpha-D-manno-heptose-1,7-bisphosphate 7-phosphatase n=1 Tax=Rhizobium sp. PL01 TaxID=3085631 RepID=UPI003992B3AA
MERSWVLLGHRLRSTSIQKTIFLDRDGTIIVDKHYLKDPNQVELVDGSVNGLVLLQSSGYRLVVVTNQSGVGRGYFSIGDVEKCNQRASELLSLAGVWIDDWLFCPHAPGENCRCRKPLPGLIDQAREIFPVDQQRSFVIGDRDSDVLLGQVANMRGLLVLTGSGKSYQKWAQDHGHRYFLDLDGAAKYILSCE